jgi:methylmalonyl-CoA mutase N-terminal domain/subunit
VLGGTQSLHTNGYDEALGLPTEQAAELALRTQQVIAHETAVPAVADPLGGSYYVESLTDRVEEEAARILEQVDAEGGAVAAIESGWMQRQIADSAFRFQRRVESADRVIVGVNRFQQSRQSDLEIERVGPHYQEAQMEAVRQLRAERDGPAVEKSLARLDEAARGCDNLLYPLKDALSVYATIGECCAVLRGVFGEYQPPDIS